MKAESRAPSLIAGSCATVSCVGTVQHCENFSRRRINFRFEETPLWQLPLWVFAWLIFLGLLRILFDQWFNSPCRISSMIGCGKDSGVKSYTSLDLSGLPNNFRERQRQLERDSVTCSERCSNHGENTNVISESCEVAVVQKVSVGA